MMYLLVSLFEFWKDINEISFNHHRSFVTYGQDSLDLYIKYRLTKNILFRICVSRVPVREISHEAVVNIHFDTSGAKTNQLNQE